MAGVGEPTLGDPPAPATRAVIGASAPAFTPRAYDEVASAVGLTSQAFERRTATVPSRMGTSADTPADIMAIVSSLRAGRGSARAATFGTSSKGTLALARIQARLISQRRGKAMAETTEEGAFEP